MYFASEKVNAARTNEDWNVTNEDWNVKPILTFPQLFKKTNIAK